MDTPRRTTVISAEKLGTRVLVIFNDGKAGMFSSPMLYGLLPHADTVYETEQPPR